MTLYAWQSTIQDDTTGAAIFEPVLEVREGDEAGSLAQLYDMDGIAIADNPITGDVNGFVQFQVEPGRYWVKATSSSEQSPGWYIDAVSYGQEVFAREHVFESRAEAETASIPDGVLSIAYRVGGVKLSFERDASGDALTTNSGSVSWSPTGCIYPDHWASNDVPGTTDMTSAIQRGLNWGSSFSKRLHFIESDYAVTSRIFNPSNTGPLMPLGARILAKSSGFTNSDYNMGAAGNDTGIVWDFSGEVTSPYSPNVGQESDGLTIIFDRPSEPRFINAVSMRNCQDIKLRDTRISGFSLSRGVNADTLSGDWLIADLFVEDFLNDYVWDGTDYDDRGSFNIFGLTLDDDWVNSTPSDPGVFRNINFKDLRHGTAPTAEYGDQADGFAIQKGGGHKIFGLRAEGVNEAIDLYSSNNIFHGVYCADNGGFGVKLIHGSCNNQFHGTHVERPGLAGVIMTGGNATNGDTEGNKFFGLSVEDVDPTGENAATTATACIKFSDQGNGSLSKNNTIIGATLDPGTYGKHVILADDSTTGNVVKDVIKVQDSTNVDGSYKIGTSADITIQEVTPMRAKMYVGSEHTVYDSETKVEFDTVAFDQSGEDCDVVNNRINTRVPGIYGYNCNVRLTGASLMTIQVFRNGGVIDTITSDVAKQNYDISGIIPDCTENGYIEIRGTLDSGTATVSNGSQYSHFEVYKL